MPYFREPHTPWCIIGKESWGVAIACRVPEFRAKEYCEKHGFTVLIRDSEFPVPLDDVGTMPDVIPVQLQSNPRRHSEPEDGA